MGFSVVPAPSSKCLFLTVHSPCIEHIAREKLHLKTCNLHIRLFVLFFLGLGPLICVAAVLVDASEAAVYVACVGLVTIGWVVRQIVVLDSTLPTLKSPSPSWGSR